MQRSCPYCSGKQWQGAVESLLDKVLTTQGEEGGKALVAVLSGLAAEVTNRYVGPVVFGGGGGGQSMSYWRACGLEYKALCAAIVGHLCLCLPHQHLLLGIYCHWLLLCVCMLLALLQASPGEGGREWAALV